MVHAIRRLTAMGSVGGEWEILSERDTFAIGPCAFRFDREEQIAPPPQPVPNVLRDKPPPPAPISTMPAAGDAIANALGGLARDASKTSGEPPMEQAAGG